MQNKITVKDGKKMDVKKVRVIGDRYAEDGETLKASGVFIDLDEEQLETLGAENIQNISNLYYGLANENSEGNDL